MHMRDGYKVKGYVQCYGVTQTTLHATVLLVALAFCHFMKLSAEPCLNQSICSSLKVWFTTTSKLSSESGFLTTSVRGTPGRNVSRPVMDTFALPETRS